MVLVSALILLFLGHILIALASTTAAVVKHSNREGIHRCDSSQQKTSLLCARSYSNTLGSVFGRDYSSIIFDAMASAIRFGCEKKSNFTSVQLVLNVGPGSSGTRSLFLAMVQLNYTSYHLGFSGMNCNIHYRHKVIGTYFFKSPSIFSTEYNKAFWGDNPVPIYWWKLYHEYPANTLFIMTDMENDLWLSKRRKPNKKRIDWESTLPVAFSIDELNYPLNSATNRTALMTAMNVWHANNRTNQIVFQAYRDLLRCTLTREQLLWLHMASPTSPTDYWTSLTRFLRISISSDQLAKLAAAGRLFSNRYLNKSFIIWMFFVGEKGSHTLETSSAASAPSTAHCGRTNPTPPSHPRCARQPDITTSTSYLLFEYYLY